MVNRFEIIFLEEAFEFLKTLEKKHYEKILYNIRKSQINKDPELFKKLTNDIWEFRTLYQGLQYRFLAFWDKTSTIETLIISTHGFIKKTSKVPENEIKKATNARTKYFAEQQNSKK
ncbi:type II toxin-antitoxin system RelE/ParE family toxin [Kaistella sp. 97-N-M2]|uniref:type II toxin-antitoxin system RelE/ParE family toxin n=1 Tax=Kaistella sp. 97-N-M2 TaxID=2908645 RepID=UPI001F21C29A|nr:type II toxin-antitoxin system RelE/ParE family toxin [Kaistella sp. 97-N-M2]UJF29386.1 type II toxin-antitoxin system RelE/ParE family toxin [Kaistella sp. 97-N-M2]